MVLLESDNKWVRFMQQDSLRNSFILIAILQDKEPERVSLEIFVE